MCGVCGDAVGGFEKCPSAIGNWLAIQIISIVIGDEP